MPIKAAINFKALIKMLLFYFTYSQNTERNTPTTAVHRKPKSVSSAFVLLHTKRMDKDTSYLNVN